MDSAFRSQLLDYVRRRCVEADQIAAPSDFASPSFSSEMSIAMISAPNSLAICTAMWPRPPMPKIARRRLGDIRSLLERPIGGYTGTKERRRLKRRKSCGNLYGVAGRHFEKLREAAVHSYTGYLLFQAKVFVAFHAERALPAGPVNPRYSDPLTNLELVDGGTFLNNVANNLMSEDQGFLSNRSQLRPIPIGKVQIGVADSASFYLDKHVFRFQHWPRSISNDERLFKFLKDRSLNDYLIYKRRQSVGRCPG